MPDYDVVVVGAGIAALAAANSAKEAGAKKVLVLEKANRKEIAVNVNKILVFIFFFKKTKKTTKANYYYRKPNPNHKRFDLVSDVKMVLILN